MSNKTPQEILNKNFLYIYPNSPAFEYQDRVELDLIQQLVETSNQIDVLKNQLQSLVVEKQNLEKEAQYYPTLIDKYSDTERKI